MFSRLAVAPGAIHSGSASAQKTFWPWISRRGCCGRRRHRCSLPGSGSYNTTFVPHGRVRMGLLTSLSLCWSWNTWSGCSRSLARPHVCCGGVEISSFANCIPMRQILGRQAEFTNPRTGERERVAAFLHDVSEYVNGGLQTGLTIGRLGEWRDTGAGLADLPRLLSVQFHVPAPTSRPSTS